MQLLILLLTSLTLTNACGSSGRPSPLYLIHRNASMLTQSQRDVQQEAQDQLASPQHVAPIKVYIASMVLNVRIPSSAASEKLCHQ